MSRSSGIVVCTTQTSDTGGDHGDDDRECDSGAFVAQVHGIVMASAWGLILPCGVLVSRYGKGWTHWFAAHRAVQVSTCVRHVAQSISTRHSSRGNAATLSCQCLSVCGFAIDFELGMASLFSFGRCNTALSLLLRSHWATWWCSPALSWRT